MRMLAVFRGESGVAIPVVNEKDTKLIKNTAFEELAKKIDEEDIQPRIIFKEIMAVYYFMLIKMGMRPRLITIDEFEIIKKSQGITVANIFHSNSDIDSHIRFFEENFQRSPFRGQSFNCFDPLGEIGKFIFFPENIQQLVREIYEKRFGRPIPRPE